MIWPDKVCTADTVHFLVSSNWCMPVTTKALLVATTRAQVNVNRAKSLASSYYFFRYCGMYSAMYVATDTVHPVSIYVCMYSI